MTHVCDATCLKWCKHRMAGDGGTGRPKAHGSVAGRDKREQAYAASHPDCECPGCIACSSFWAAAGTVTHPRPCLSRPTEIDHIGGRGLGGHKRTTARLRHLCGPCHQQDPHGRKALPPSGLGAIR